jgi:tetratricopeptide (TPR) repeat protein
MFAKILSCFLIIFGANAVYADNAAVKDAATLVEAFSELKNGNLPNVVKKTDQIIERFERENDAQSQETQYICGSSFNDVMTGLAGAAGAAQENGIKSIKVVSVSSAVCVAYFLKGYVLIDMQQRDQALPNLKMAVKLDPDNQHYANELAEWYKAGGQWQKSLELFTAASEMTDLSVESQEDQKASMQMLNAMRCRSYRGIAFNHVELANWAEAREALEKCLKLIPGDPKSKVELEFIETKAKK